MRAAYREPAAAKAAVADRRPGRGSRLARASRLTFAAACLIASLGLQGIMSFPAAASTWTATDQPMNLARFAHTASLLADGTVLVAGGVAPGVRAAGGSDPELPTGSAELYNSAGKMWSQTNSMAISRYYHSATLLDDGQVLAVGGRTFTSPSAGDSNFLDSNAAELYNPDLRAWSPTGSLTTPRDSHTATLLRGGKVLVTGGNTNGTPRCCLPTLEHEVVSSAETYDPLTQAWLSTDSMASARANHTATRLPDGRVLVAGGYSEWLRTPQASAELFDPIAGTWSSTGSLATARAGHTATVLPDGRILVTAGYDAEGQALASAELYDPATGEWSPTADLRSPRAVHTATLVGGKVLVVGGNGVLAANRDPTAELYDPATEKWNQSGSVTKPRSGHTATTLPGGTVLLAGGCGGETCCTPCPFNSPLSSSELRLSADLSITATDVPDPLEPGKTLTYSLGIQNLGPDPAETVTVRNALPAGLEFVSGSPGCEEESAGVVICSLGSLASGGSAHQRQITVRPGQADPALSSTASVESPTDDLDAANNSATTTTEVRIASAGGGVTPPSSAPEAGVPNPANLDWALARESRRSSAFRSCLTRAARHTRVDRAATRRGSRLTRALAWRHLRRHRAGMRRRCVARHGRTPDRVTGLSGRAPSRRVLELSFRAPGTDRNRPPPARGYLVKQSTKPITDLRSFRRAQTLCNGSCRFPVTRVGEQVKLRINDLRPRTTYYYAVAARDNVSGRLGPRSRAVRARTG